MRLDRWFLGLFLAVGLTGSARAAAPPAVTIENVRVGYGDGTRDGQYKTGTWTPIWVDLKAGAEPFSGFVEVGAADDSGTGTRMVFRLQEIPRNEMRTMLVYGRPSARGNDLGLRILDARGRPKAGWNGGNVESLGAEASLVLTAGNPQGVGDMATLPKFSGNGPGLTPWLMVQPIRRRDGLPGRWIGFDGADSIVIDTNDSVFLDNLAQSGKAAALLRWVAGGGHLVVAVGRNWQKVVEGPLAEALPAVPAGRLKLTDRGPIELFAESDPSDPRGRHPGHPAPGLGGAGRRAPGGLGRHAPGRSRALWLRPGHGDWAGRG